MKTIEQQLKEVLSAVSGETISGQWILSAINTGKPPFEKLISELKDQLRDAPNSLKNVIGEEGIQLLKKL